MPNTIKLRTHKAPEVKEELIGTIKITPEAEIIIRQLRRETGLSGRSIASQIIIQAASMIEVVEVD
ncbi:MAG: hypothetical protein AB9835_14355 [Eubacteriales bacterium]